MSNYRIVSLMTVFIILSCSTQQTKNPIATVYKQVNTDITFYEGYGGDGIRLSVLEPTGVNITNDQKWLLSMIQGTLTGYFNKYTNMTILDRQNLEKILNEQSLSLSGYYSDKDYVRIGNLTNTQYTLVGKLTRTPSGFLLDIGINHIETNERIASNSPRISSLAELQTQEIIKESFIDLLKQLGIVLTEQGRNELNKKQNNEISADIALARGIIAQRNGTSVHALSYYLEATNFNPSLQEAASRLNILTVNINSGNIGVDVRNDIEWRDRWVACIKECEEFYSNTMKEYLPYYIIYDNKLGHLDQVDYNKRTYPLTLKMGAFPVVSWFSSINKVVQTVKQGLNATKRADAWGLGKWPRESLLTPNPFNAFVGGYTIVVEILNSDGKKIAGGPVNLIYGWEVDMNWSGNVARPIGGECNVVFYGVDPYATTDNLSIKIVSIDGIRTENMPAERRISIMTYNEYSRIPGVAK